MSVSDEIKEISKAIRETLYNEQYEESVKLCTKLIELLKKNTEDTKDSNLWYAYYSRGNSYYKLKQYHKALLDVEESFYYVGSVDKLNDQYTFSLWLVAAIEARTGNENNAIGKYKMLSKFYKAMGYPNLRIAAIYNIAELLNKTDKMFKLKEIANTYERLRSNKTNLTKKELINQMKNKK